MAELYQVFNTPIAKFNNFTLKEYIIHKFFIWIAAWAGLVDNVIAICSLSMIYTNLQFDIICYAAILDCKMKTKRKYSGSTR